MARTPRILAGGIGAAVLISGAVVAPAQARPVDSGSFSDPFVEPIECENRSLELEATIVGSYVIKDSTPKTGGQFFKFSQTAEFNGTFTDLGTGETFTEYWRTNFGRGLGRSSPTTAASSDGRPRRAASGMSSATPAGRWCTETPERSSRTTRGTPSATACPEPRSSALSSVARRAASPHSIWASARSRRRSSGSPALMRPLPGGG